LLTVFAGGSHCLWCPKSRWSPPLGTPITLKIGKIWLEARKLQSRGGGLFCRKFSMKQLIAYFWTPQKALKYYCVAVTRWFVKDGDFRALLNCSIWTKKWESAYEIAQFEQKNEKVLHWWSRRGQNEEKWKKLVLQFEKTYFFLLLFFGCSLALHFKDDL